MTTILLMLLFPIGALFYRYELKNRGKYQAIFDDYIQKVDASDLSDSEKLEQVKKLFLANRYEVRHLDEKEIVGERKVLSMGLLMMGLFFYILYFFFFQKPHQIFYKANSLS